MATTKSLHRPPISSERLRKIASDRPLLAYFALAFGFAWVYELLVYRMLGLPELPWLIPAAFAPPVAAILVTWAVDGSVAVHALLRRLLIWRVDARLYGLILLVIPAISFLIFAFLPDGTENFPDSALLFLPTYVALLVVMVLFGGGQEELGWRGFALPRMQVRYGPLPASLLLGALWGLWHLPLFVWVPNYDNAGSGFVHISATFLGFVVYTIVLATVLTWIFNQTSGSVFMTMLMHGSMNAVFAFAPSTGLATAGMVMLVTVLALIVVVYTRGSLGYRAGDGASEPVPTSD